MLAARRLYLYLATAISLEVVTWSTIALLRTVLPGGLAPVLDTVAFQAAALLVALPVYLAHWVWAERLARAEADERGSVIRRVFLYGMLALFLAPMITNATALLDAYLGQALGVHAFGGMLFESRSIFASPATSLADLTTRNLSGLVVLSVLWLYHWRVVRADEQALPPSGDVAAVRRFYLLGFSLVGGVMLILGATRVLRWVLQTLALGAVISTPPRDLLAREAARLIVGIAVWALAWRSAQTLRARGGEEEASSALRLAYLYLAAVGAALGVVLNLAQLLTGVFRLLLGLPPGGDFRGPLPSVVILACVWVYHARILRREAVGADRPRQGAVRRTYIYLVAVVGLVAMGVGLFAILDTLVGTLLGITVGVAEKERLAWSAATVVASLPVWLWAWRNAQAAVYAPDASADERASTARRLYLYLALFLGGLMALSGTVYLVYRPLASLLGAPPPADLTSRLAVAVTLVIIGGATWLYHGLVLRSDGALGRQVRADRLNALNAVLVAADDGSFSRAVMDGLRRELPELVVTTLPVTSVAAAGLEQPLDLAAAVDRIQAAGLLIGPWDMAQAHGPSGIPPEVAAAVAANPGRQLLVPLPSATVDWAGVEHHTPETAARQTVSAIRQLAAGEPVGPERTFSTYGAALLLAVIAALMTILVLGSALMGWMGN